MRVTEIEKIRIQQAIIDGLSEYNKSLTDMEKNVEKIVNDTTDKIVKVLEA